MIESVEFRNFRVLRNTTLPLSRLTLIIGPNGSGKSTAIQALQAVASPGNLCFDRVVTVGLQPTDEVRVEVIVHWGWGEPHQEMISLEEPHQGDETTMWWTPNSQLNPSPENSPAQLWRSRLGQMRSFSLDARAIACPTQLQPNMELQSDGSHHAGVLDHLRDYDPEKFEALNEELGRWLPEFNRILFGTPASGHRSFMLRTRQGHYAIPASDLSQGTLFALTLLTLAYLPDPPPLVCLEEPDKGIHPRLLRRVQDALYRLSYPENYGETRPPVQVLATTHSPYFLDLFKDHPEEIVLAQKVGLEARFERLSERPDIDEILAGATLGGDRIHGSWAVCQQSHESRGPK